MKHTKELIQKKNKQTGGITKIKNKLKLRKGTSIIIFYNENYKNYKELTCKRIDFESQAKVM